MKEMTVKTKEFWDVRSKSFPGHRSGDTYQQAMLDIALSHGVDFAGKKVMDLGCGAGAYTLRIAGMAQSVTALDISSGMLERLKADADAEGFTNIRCVLSDWMNYKEDEKFDIIFASLTPALKDDAACDRLKNHADTVIYITFAGPMKAYVLDGLFELHGGKWKGMTPEPVFKNWLEKNGIAYASYRHKGQWRTPKNREDTINNCIDVLNAHKITPDIKIIEDYIERFREADSYISKTDYDVEMIIFDF
jgi:SAM-dependent methyltransferase